MEILKWIETWYNDQCNGDWEHSFGIKIETIDNPGWLIEIDLTETDYADLKLDYVFIESDINNWHGRKVENAVYKAFGDPSKLEFLLLEFKKWTEKR